MFELSVAFKYLLPQRKQLSVSIISVISILVIALVVWLIVLFFSVTNGLEKNWIEKLTALTAPIRITPKEAYYNSYYYQIDSISAQSNYSLKSIAEKREVAFVDPFDPELDETAPSYWPPPALDSENHLKDLVSEVFDTIETLPGYPGLKASDYEVTGANLRLRVVRDLGNPYQRGPSLQQEQGQGFLSSASYLGSVDKDNLTLSRSLLPLKGKDLTNILKMQSVASQNEREDIPNAILSANPNSIKMRLKNFFQSVTVNTLKTPPKGWTAPPSLFPETGQFQALKVEEGSTLIGYLIPQKADTLSPLKEELEQEGLTALPTTLLFSKKKPSENGEPLDPNTQLILEGDLSFPASLDKNWETVAKSSEQILFDVQIPLQDQHFSGITSLSDLEIATATFNNKYSTQPITPLPWYYFVDEGATTLFSLPFDEELGDGILLPKSFRESGILAGDRGYLSYQAPTASSIQEQRLPIFVAGFYDQGLIPIGGKFILASRDVTSIIRASNMVDNTVKSNGINVRYDNLSQTAQLKSALKKALKEKGLDPYWEVETYREYEFTKDLIAQLNSDKNLFLLIATVIIIVACSNIISMLIILVNDKKLEIGILRSMGASSKSIAFIFGFCGTFMGLAGSLIGTAAALITLKNLDLLVIFLSKVQGYQAFNPLFYGDALPNTISLEALTFVFTATVLVSLIAGIVPAVKASLLKPATILRSE